MPGRASGQAVTQEVGGGVYQGGYEWVGCTRAGVGTVH